VAHNPAAVKTLVDGLRGAEVGRPLHGLLGILRDKDAEQVVSLLSRELEVLWVTTPPSAPEERRSDLAEVAQLAAGDVVVEPDFARALAGVQQHAATVLVTGSFHTVGDAMSRLPGFAPLG
jgi:dihydrofolate synthase/folylpolyglutamate synthase